jgi:pimeloyl-ACP methyl ester carboxylesterase
MKFQISSKFLLLLFLISGLVFTQSCSDKETIFTPQILVQQNLFLNRSANDLRTFINASGLAISANEMKYDVEIYKVTYRTMHKGSQITASGVVILPKTTEPVGMLCFNHGTIASNAEAPTMTNLSSTLWLFYAALASPGFIAVIPDFIGFGASSEITHPYYVEEYTASAIYDNLLAAAELARLNNTNFSKNLFLSGYSQGGYATMATHKYIEQNPTSDFNLVASFPASGGYDVKAMQEYFFGLETYDDPFFLAYVALAYKEHYNWNQGLNIMFNEPYASIIPGLFDKTKSGSQINAQLTTNVAELVKADLLENIDTDPQYSFIVDAFHDNSLVDWQPTKPIYMYHGTADVTVPYENSVISYEKLINKGANPQLLTFIPLEGGTHGTGVIPYIEKFMNKVLELK